MSAMVAAGEVVRVDHGLYFERRAYDEMVNRVLDAIEREGSVTVGSVRDMLGTSRKYVLALLEHLDAERITQRAGDARRAGSRAPSRA